MDSPDVDFKISRACYDQPRNPMTFPPAVPEVPVANIDNAAAYYVNTLGFTFDWGDEQGGIADLSKGDCRLFITNPPPANPTAT
jgi:hypothetical protein